MNGLGILEALPDQFNVSLRCRNPACRFLLKSVQNVQDTLKAHRVDGPVRIAVEIVVDFKDSAKTLQGFRATWMVPKLRFKKGLTDLAANGRRECPQVFPAGAHKNRGLKRAQ